MTGDEASDRTADGTDGEFPAEEAFALIGDELRAEILRVLGERPHEGLSFSELRRSVDEDVDSGQFNYHLQKLVGHFLERTDDGYVMRASGLALYRAIKSGTFTRRVSIDPFEVGFDCYFCETAVEATYEDGDFEMACPGCGHVYTYTNLPPSAIDEDREALLDRVDQYNRHRFLAASRGVCPVCANSLGLDFRTGDEVWTDGADRLDVFVHRGCSNCGRDNYTSVGLTLLYHPAVVSFYRDCGRDLTSIPHWELPWVMTDDHLTVRSRDPWEFLLRVPCGGETLELVVDEELTVVAERRE